MKRIGFLIITFLLLWVVVYALDYIESSSGLQDPQLESGRTELELADVDGDGNIDILSIGDHGSPYINTQEHGVMVWFGDGAGNWSVFQNGNFGYGGIAVGDLNNDGYLDIGYGMHHNYSGNDFGDSILEAALGDGTGQNWQPWDNGITINNPGQWGMFCTDFADVDNDGLLDLGANSFGSGDGIHIYLNNGDGTWIQCFGFLGGNSTMDFCFGDINADGNADFVVAHEYGSVYLGDGSGNFALGDGNLPPAGWVGRQGPSLGDIDNDGDQDFAFCNADGGVEVWAWQGNDSWMNASGVLPGTGSYDVTQLCDMNIDGFMDVVAFGGGTAAIWLGNGMGNWTLDATITTPAPGQFSAFRVGGDADHNGYPDIACVAKEGDTWNAVNHLRFFKESSTPESLFVYPVYPRGGERFYPGSVCFIDWTCGVPDTIIAQIRLELSTTGPGGSYEIIADSINNSGRFQWSVPQAISSTDCYIRYTAMTPGDTATATTPNAFTIASGTMVEEGWKKIFVDDMINLCVVPTVNKSEFSIHISATGSDAKDVAIYDQNGVLVRDLLTLFGSGRFVLPWDRRDNNKRLVASGTYFVTIQGDGNRATVKIVVID
jgi:hypothetical protein